MTKLFIALSIWVLSHLAFPIDASEAVTKARKDCLAANVPFNSSRAVAKPMGPPGDRRWMVAAGNAIVVLDYASGRLLLLEATDRAARLRKSAHVPAALAIRTDGDALAAARSVLERAGYAHSSNRYTVRRHPWGAGTNDNARGKAIVRFESQPHGHRSFGKGNKAIVTLDTETGQVVSVETETRWNYVPPPSNRIGAVAANNIARPFVGEPIRTELGYFTPNDGFHSPEGDTLLRQKRARLSYCAVSANGSILIDAESGEILGGGLITSPRNPQGSEATVRARKWGQRQTQTKPSEKKRLASCFGYSHVPDSRIFVYKVGGRQNYRFMDGKTSSEMLMGKNWPRQQWPNVAVFDPAKDGPTIKRPIVDRGAAIRILAPVMDAVGANQVKIDSFSVGPARRLVDKKYVGKSVADIRGTMGFEDGTDLEFVAVVIPSSGRFLYWGASEVRRK
jgi:hypothetical protein